MDEMSKMPDGNKLPEERPALWPSLLFSVIVATFFSVMWLTRGAYQILDFRLLLAPIYIPLAFGIIWPVTVALQALATPAARGDKLRRNWVALILFVISGICWLPFVTAEMAVSRREREEAVLQEELHQQQHAEREAAQASFERGGLLAFTEPMTSQEMDVLERFIDGHHLSAEELEQASEHYQAPQIMQELAEKPDCPPGALETLFEHAIGQQQIVSEVLRPSVLGPVFAAIGKNANTPVRILVEMIGSDDPYIRTAAVDNPNLPKAAKMAYLKKGCGLSWPSELNFVGADADTPVGVLVCLSTKQSAAFAVARNPHTPTSVIETMSKSDDFWLKTAGQESLPKRQGTAK
jgi:uncharacterized membrane protein